MEKEFDGLSGGGPAPHPVAQRIDEAVFDERLIEIPRAVECPFIRRNRTGECDIIFSPGRSAEIQRVAFFWKTGRGRTAHGDVCGGREVRGGVERRGAWAFRRVAIEPAGVIEVILFQWAGAVVVEHQHGQDAGETEEVSGGRTADFHEMSARGATFGGIVGGEDGGLDDHGRADGKGRGVFE